jgi:hypothetical protein
MTRRKFHEFIAICIPLEILQPKNYPECLAVATQHIQIDTSRVGIPIPMPTPSAILFEVFVPPGSCALPVTPVPVVFGRIVVVECSVTVAVRRWEDNVVVKPVDRRAFFSTRVPWNQVQGEGG